MKIEINKVQVGRQMGMEMRDYKKFPGYQISISFGGPTSMTIGINDGLTMNEVKQLRNALNKLDLSNPFTH